jgi:hypothetical protein
MKPEENFKRVVEHYGPRLKALFPFTYDDVAAIFGNLGHESNGMTAMQEYGIEITDPKAPERGPGGWSWAQWTGPRRRQFFSYSRTKDLLPNSMEAAFRFLVEELNTTEAKAVQAVIQPLDLYGKVVAFERAYERAGVKNYNARLKWAVLAQQTLRNLTDTHAPAPEEKEGTSMSSMILSLILGRAKAIIALFLTGLVTLIVQSVEQGSGFQIPDSWEAYVVSLVSALVVAIGVERVPNKKV